MAYAKSRFTPWYLIKQAALAISVSGAFYAFGDWIDRQEDLRMIRFRDKSALYGRELKPGEPPSWP